MTPSSILERLELSATSGQAVSVAARDGALITLLGLAVGTFAVGTEGFMIAGLLPRVAGDFGISVALAGHLVTAFALSYAIGSPVLTTLAAATMAPERSTKMPK